MPATTKTPVTPSKTVVDVFAQIDANIKNMETNSIKSFVSTSLSTASVAVSVVKNELIDLYEDQMFDRAKKRAQRIADGW